MIDNDPDNVPISIHALLAESDNTLVIFFHFVFDFYPRSPCGERLGTLRTVKVKNTFLSTLSLRRATNARPEIRRFDAISIHALLAESDANTARRIAAE